MDQYVAKVTVDIDGAEYTDYFEITPQKVDYRKEVELANKVGTCDVLPVYKITIKNGVPKGKPGIPWASMDGTNTLTIDKKDGTSLAYKGVACLSAGGESYGTNDAAKYDVELLAEGLQ